MTRERIGRFCIILGGLCILAAAFLLGFNLREERRAAAATQRILPAVAHSIGQSPAPMPTLPAGELTVSLEGEEYLGILSLPTLALELPVGAEWEMDFLRQAPCRYAGTLAGDDIIIAAHNYRRHFAALHTLRPGDAVLFTDAAGQTYRYTVGQGGDPAGDRRGGNAGWGVGSYPVYLHLRWPCPSNGAVHPHGRITHFAFFS